MNPINFLVDTMMLPVLEFCYALAGNYGLAIVLVTIAIKVILLPLTMQSYYSMKNMQIIQPKMKQIQERYKKKPEEMNKRIMQLYKEHKVNPLGGCLPLLVQMPFLIALYAALMSEQFIKLLKDSGDFAFWLISDLSRSGVRVSVEDAEKFLSQANLMPFGEGMLLNIENLILVALFGITTVWQQKVMQAGQQSADPKAQTMQKQMMVMMPVMITVMFLIFPIPSGVFIYMIVSNFIGVAQYAYLNQRDVPAPKLAGGGDSGKVLDSDSKSSDKEGLLDISGDEDEPELVSSHASKTQNQSGQSKKRRTGKKKHYRRKKRKK